MARPQKVGLDYFPMDVDFFNDEKIQFVAARFQERGELIVVKLLTRIYRNGYFLKWDNDMALLFSSTAGKNVTPGLANSVVNELLERGFFEVNLYRRFAILTSNGIQKRYEKICKLSGRIIEIDKRFLIKNEETEVNSEETGVSPPKKYTKESKVKESKVKGERDARARPPHPFFESEIFDKNFFGEALTGTQYELADIDYYHEKINNWAESKNVKKNNWLAVAKNWMADDMVEGKFISKDFKPPSNGTHSRNSENGHSTKPGTSQARVDALGKWGLGGSGD